MATSVSQPGYYNLQQFTSAGALLASGRLYTYTAGTTTKKVAYTEQTGTTAHTYTADGVGGEYIALDARGELPAPLYLTTGAYDLTLKTSAGATIWTRRADPMMDADVDMTSVTGVLPVANGGTGSATSAGAPFALKGNNSDIDSLRGLGVTSLTPTNNIPDGSLGLGSLNSVVTRSGGYGQYGDDITQYLVTAATPSPQFDVGKTAWVTMTNLTGGAAFGMWSGANTPSAGLAQTFTSGSAVGHEINAGNRWADFGLQADAGGTRYTVGLQVVPDVLPALDGLDTKSVTISIATPGVVTLASHGATAGMGVKFQGAGTIPTGLAKDTVYYISATGLGANDFQVSATPGGSSIATSGSFVAPITAILSWPGSFGTMQGPSVWGHRWWTGYLNRYDTIMPGGYLNRDYGGSLANQAPLAHTKIDGFWTNGIDFSGGSYANAVMKFSAGQVSGTATAGGGVTVPATVNGFLIVDVGGVLKRIPYFNA